MSAHPALTPKEGWVFRTRTRSLKSNAWSHVLVRQAQTKSKDINEVLCGYCHTRILLSKGTSNILQHMKRYHPTISVGM